MRVETTINATRNKQNKRVTQNSREARRTQARPQHVVAPGGEAAHGRRPRSVAAHGAVRVQHPVAVDVVVVVVGAAVAAVGTGTCVVGAALAAVRVVLRRAGHVSAPLLAKAIVSEEI